jgi:hypothetical protein
MGFGLTGCGGDQNPEGMPKGPVAEPSQSDKDRLKAAISIPKKKQ